MRVGPEDLGPASGDVAAGFIFRRSTVSLWVHSHTSALPAPGKTKELRKMKKNSCILSVLGNLQLESDPRFLPFTCLLTYSVIYPLVYLITHALIKQSDIYSFDHLFIHIFNKYLLGDYSMPSPALSGPVDTLMTTKPWPWPREQWRRQTLNINQFPTELTPIKVFTTGKIQNLWGHLIRRPEFR